LLLAGASGSLHGRQMPTKPTPAEAEHRKQTGRLLPAREFLQPTLDAGLAA